MSEIRKATSGTLSFAQGIRSKLYVARMLMDNPTFFRPDGIWVFCGPQGSGKTISAVQCARRVAKEYPAARVISNIDFMLEDGSRPEPFEDYDQLTVEDNGIHGLIFLLDEIHVLWNSLESRKIPISEMAALCQMRKSRRLIIGTSQVYSRIAKPIREQLKYVIDCHLILGVLQHNIVCDPTEATEIQGHINPEVICERYWFHTPELYESYETFEKVKRIDRKPSQMMEVYRG